MSRRLNLAESNPVMAAIQGYKAVDDIFETNRQRKRAEEDRSMAIEDRERNNAWQQEQQKQSRLGWQRAEETHNDQKTQRELNEAIYHMQGFQQNNVPFEQRMHWLQQQPETVQRALLGNIPDEDLDSHVQSYRLFHQAAALMEQGDMNRAEQVFAEAMNLGHGLEINQGTAREGLTDVKKRVVGGRLHPSGEAIAPVLEITGVDKTGKRVSYIAPSTKGQGTDANDIVNFIPIEQLMKTVHDRASVAQWMKNAKGKLVGLGDNAPIEEARTRQAAALVGKAITLYNPKKSARENITSIYGKAIKDNPDADPVAVMNAVKTMVDMEAAEKEKPIIVGPGTVAIRSDGTEIYHNDAGGKSGGAGSDGDSPLTFNQAVSNVRSAGDQLQRALRNEGVQDIHFDKEAADEGIEIARRNYIEQLRTFNMTFPDRFGSIYKDNPEAQQVINEVKNRGILDPQPQPEPEVASPKTEEEARAAGWQRTMKVHSQSGKRTVVWFDPKNPEKYFGVAP